MLGIFDKRCRTRGLSCSIFVWRIEYTTRGADKKPPCCPQLKRRLIDVFPVRIMKERSGRSLAAPAVILFLSSVTIYCSHASVPSSTAPGAIFRRASPFDWASRTVYQLLTDRFARPNNDTSSCGDIRNYCGGGFRGILNNLDYIQHVVGADAIWISPVPENTDGGYWPVAK